MVYNLWRVKAGDLAGYYVLKTMMRMSRMKMSTMIVMVLPAGQHGCTT